MKLTKEVKVGLLALVAGVILYIGFNFLKGVDFLSPTKRYFIIYNDVDGLTVSNPVETNGLTVGRVNSISLLPNRGNKILVVIDIDDALVVGDSTVAVLSNSDLLGGKNIVLKLGKNSKVYANNDTLKGYKDRPFTEVLQERAMPILTNLDSTVQKVNKVFGDQLGTSIGVTMHNFELASHDLRAMMSENRRNVSTITSNIASLTTSLNETEKSVKPLISKLSAFADSLNDLQLKQAVARADAAMKSLQDITTKINNGQGTLGLMVNDKRVYDNLDQSIKDLDKLLIDLQKNPKRYVHFSVFGGKDKKEAAATTTPTTTPTK